MKKIVICAASAGLMALGACNNTNTDASLNVSNSVQESATDEKALYTAEAAFQGASHALEAAVDSGRLKGERAAKANKYYAEAYQALSKARTVHAAANSDLIKIVLDNAASIMMLASGKDA